MGTKKSKVMQSLCVLHLPKLISLSLYFANPISPMRKVGLRDQVTHKANPTSTSQCQKKQLNKTK